MSQLVEIKVPDIGDFAEVAIIEILVSVGDTIEPEQSLITVESDKASMEIPASQGGVVKSLKVKIGDKVAEGSVILEVEAADNGAATPRAEAATLASAPVASSAASVAAPAPASQPTGSRAPAVRPEPKERQPPAPRRCDRRVSSSIYLAISSKSDWERALPMSE